MANVEHSTLTGASLHEPKGVAAAAANRVYVSDGLGSGAWGQVTNDVLATTAKAFQGGYAHYRNSQTSGTAGTAITEGSWQTYPINTEVADPSSMGSLASNQITLAAGTYFCAGAITVAIDSGSGGNTAWWGAAARLRNTTAGTTLLRSLNGKHRHNTTETFNDVEINFSLNIWGWFTLGSTSTLEVQTYCRSESGNYTTGLALSTGENENYADIMFWKIA